MLPRKATLPLTGLLLVPLYSFGFTYDTPAVTPEVGSGYEEKPGWAFDEFAVAAANPLAADAGRQILAAGGNAIDAAIAVQMVLTLVEPQSSGIGGGAFLMYAEGANVEAFDGRETAPQAATETMFMDDGEPIAFMDAVVSGQAVGVPGTLKMLESAHAAHGKLDWKTLFVPAITLAEEGFPVSQRLHTSIAEDPALGDDPLAGAFYFDENGEPLDVGETLTNPALAAILRLIAEQGSQAFYEGEVARDLVERVTNHPTRPGAMTLEDLAGYESVTRDALCTPWQQWRVCGFPPPSSGHITVMQILGMLDDQPMIEAPLDNGVASASWLHQFLEASRLAFADRNRYIGDPEFVEAPGGDWAMMLAPDYLERRSQLIGESSMGDTAEPGNPGEFVVSYASQPTQPEYGTSHISIVDEDGNAVAMTTTIEQAFGSRIMADGGTGLPGGYLLNNEMTDFSFTPEIDGEPVANRIEPGKRPRSSMSPTLVFDQESGDFVASLGSPGGAAIIHYTARTLMAMRDWGLSAQEALNLPHAVTLGSDVWLEEGRFPEATIDSLTERGHNVSERELTSGLQAIRRLEDGTLFGGADPRREGVVEGE
ncbi:gamma-glutamyltransferase [Vreelandella malpeensis]|uniref:Glutathione hydrolase proenzyme n=1 Tax=Vreelandella malpeensis TaxID=1172368 RepID=A0ABS8DVT9_9GAMM|nr:gamma-glutamyltransferase [Halomonas malpeensis]MCB8890378.1 gamma-glutamyltransferase [Halomonas malpeensis]